MDVEVVTTKVAVSEVVMEAEGAALEVVEVPVEVPKSP